MNQYDAVVAQLRSNPSQWRALESTGNCVTLAGPGSGKTKLLTAKIARLLREEIRPPRGLACVTFNNECVREIERRLDSLGVVQNQYLFTGTLHGFCLRHVLAPFASVVGIRVPQPIRIASERQQRAAFENAMRSVGVTMEGFRTPFDRFRRSAVDRVEGKDGWRTGDGGLTDVCVEYESLLRQQGRVDFDDIILLTMNAVERSSTIRRAIRARFPALIVDEYQDLGIPLHRIVMALCFGSGVRLFAVGDPDQSIYGFTGAKPELLKNLAVHEGVESVTLNVNYRSTRRIVRASEYALGETRDYVPASTADGHVEFTLCGAGLQAQVTHVVENLIPGMIAGGDAYGDIAVLYPTQFEGDAVDEGFVERGLPFVRIDRGAGYRRTPFIRLIEDFVSWSVGENTPRLGALLGDWSDILGRQSADERLTRRRLVRFLFAHRNQAVLAGTWLAHFVNDVLTPDLRTAMDDDDRDAIDELVSATTTGRLRKVDVQTFAGKSGSRNHIKLMNFHTAKGTEYNAVILVGMDDGRMPIYRSNDVLEQRRLFFVGVSRAKREVHLLYSGFTTNRYGTRFDSGPSPFLLELRRKLEAP